MEGLKSDENMAVGMLTEAEKFIAQEQYSTCDGLMKELYSHENWREKYGGRILLLRAYCAIKLGDPKLGMDFIGAFRKRI